MYSYNWPNSQMSSTIKVIVSLADIWAFLLVWSINTGDFVVNVCTKIISFCDSSINIVFKQNLAFSTKDMLTVVSVFQIYH